MPEYPEAAELAARLLDTVKAWEAGQGAALPYTEQSWRIAEALHLLTFERPHSHAPLGLLLDEERTPYSSYTP